MPNSCSPLRFQLSPCLLRDSHPQVSALLQPNTQLENTIEQFLPSQLALKLRMMVLSFTLGSSDPHRVQLKGKRVKSTDTSDTYLSTLCDCVCAGVACTWRQEDSIWDLAHPFGHVTPRNGIQLGQAWGQESLHVEPSHQPQIKRFSNSISKDWKLAIAGDVASFWSIKDRWWHRNHLS